MKKVVLMLNNSCNWRCEHCYLPGGKDKSPELALRQARQLLYDGYEVNPAGAEVLLDSRYLEIYQLVGQKHILTNGIAIVKNPALLDEIRLCGIEEIRLSRHYLIHKDLNGAPLSVVDKAISLIIESGLRLIIESVVDSRNYLRIAEACYETKRIGAQGIRFVRLTKSGRAVVFSKELFLSGTQAHEVLEQIQLARTIFTKNDLIIKRNGTFGPKRGTSCPAADSFFAISVDDQIYPCPFMMDEKNIIGKLHKGKMVMANSLLEGCDRTKCLAHQNTY